METSDKNLANSLDTLPINSGQVMLWLVYRGLKPMATIDLDFEWGTDLVQGKKLRTWFRKAGIYFAESRISPRSIHVSRKKSLLELNRKYELFQTAKAHLVRGRLFGIPEAAAKTYSQVILKPNPFPNEEIIHPPLVRGLDKKYWYPYVEYLLRRGHEIEDSKTAKDWADIIRKEIPGVAFSYETRRLKELKKQRTNLKRLGWY